MSDFETRRAERIERLQARATAARAESEAHSAKATRMADVMQGEPIKIGHHSEGRHRRDIERMDNAMRASCEASDKAAHYAAAASAAANNRAVSSDDPEAVAKLVEKVEYLKQQQAIWREINAAHKRYVKDPATLESALLPDAAKEIVRNYKPAYSWEPHPVAPFQLTNNLANIKRIEARIKELSATADDKTSEEEIGGVRIVNNVEENRVQMFFPGKPDEGVRSQLKSYGFRWAPSVGAWQRQRSEGALYVARQIAQGLVTP